MPDILIRGMEMPKSCRECFACFPGRDANDEPTTYCTLTKPTSPADCWGVIDGIDHQRQRMDFCPLHELPPHGDLIDADSLANDLLYDAELAGRALDDTTLVGKEREYLQSEKDIKQNCAYYVSHSPVIVPASEEVTNG